MTDRELLELAAKAARLNVKGHRVDSDGKFIGIIVGKKFTKEKILWNPLTNDGDALRLAVYLGIAPIQDKKEKICTAYWSDVLCRISPYKEDQYSATRRAITRAAAAIQLAKEAK